MFNDDCLRRWPPLLIFLTICLLGPKCEHSYPRKTILSLLSADVQLSLVLLRWLCCAIHLQLGFLVCVGVSSVSWHRCSVIIQGTSISLMPVSLLDSKVHFIGDYFCILLEVVLSWHWNLHGRYFIVKSLLTDVQQDIDGKMRKEAERKWSLDEVRRSHC